MPTGSREREFVMRGMPDNIWDCDGLLPNFTSVGIVAHTGFLVPSRGIRRVEPSVLLVCSSDQPGKPWGFPAGKRLGDESMEETAIREFGEETGLPIDAERLQWFYHLSRGKHLLAYQLPLGFEQYLNLLATGQFDTKLYEPPASVDRAEINGIVLVPIEVLFDPYINTPFVNSLYRQDVVHSIKIALMRSHVIPTHPS